jgi:SEC-C motif
VREGFTMAASDRSRKLLWGRAANRCSFPGCEVAMSSELSLSGAAVVFGEEAHIVGSKPGSARHDPGYGHDLDDYENLILLCPTHHTQVDKDAPRFSVELLRLMKDRHEQRLSVSTSASTPRVSNLPRHGRLVDRVALRAAVEHALSSHGLAVLMGLAGTGKSWAAVAFCRQRSDAGQIVWILRATSDETFAADSVKLLQRLGVENVPATEARQMLREELDRREAWTLVIDDAGSLTQFSDFVSLATTGDLIVTTRNRAGVPSGSEVDVGGLELAECVELLGAGSGQAATEDAQAVALILGGHALALAQLRNLMRSSGLNLGHYRGLLDDRVRVLATAEPDTAYPSNVITVLQLAINEATKHSPAVVEFLELLATFAPASIPLAYLEEDTSIFRAVPAYSDTGLVDRYRRLVEPLVRASLLNAVEGHVSLHPLIRDVVRERTDPRRHVQLIDTVASSLLQIEPVAADSATWHVDIADWMPHAIAVATDAENAQNASAAARLRHDIGTVYSAFGATVQAYLHIALSAASAPLVSLSEDLNRLGILTKAGGFAHRANIVADAWWLLTSATAQAGHAKAGGLSAWTALAAFYDHHGCNELARQAFESHIIRGLEKLPPGNPHRAIALAQYGNFLLIDDPERATAVLQQALDEKRLFAPFRSPNPEQIRSLLSLTDAHTQTGRAEAARRTLAEAKHQASALGDAGQQFAALIALLAGNFGPTSVFGRDRLAGREKWTTVRFAIPLIRAGEAYSTIRRIAPELPAEYGSYRRSVYSRCSLLARMTPGRVPDLLPLDLAICERFVTVASGDPRTLLASLDSLTADILQTDPSAAFCPRQPRNEACACGSGRKHKDCCVDQFDPAPKIGRCEPYLSWPVFL